jgi:vacuolar transporter chaperone complex subunit 2/3
MQIYAFQHDISQQMESKLGDLEDEVESSPKDTPMDARIRKRIEAELDTIVEELKELEKFSRVNFTGFMKVTTRCATLNSRSPRNMTKCMIFWFGFVLM